jgi:4-hydroxy-2-oxoheptanedioate aldolase
MRENKLRRIWKSGGVAVNGWLAIPNSFSAETMAHQGWDSLTVDMQHGVVDYQAMVTMLQAISTTDTVPVVRVPWLEPGILMKSLDAGAYGLICPMVNSREDAERLVAWTHYAPRGTRSFGPVRASLYGGADYAALANETIVTFAMIETAAALDRIDDILSVEGLDAIYIGPSDLSLSLGCTPVLDDLDPKARRRRRPRPRPRPGARRRRRHPQRQPGDGAGAHRQGLPVRHRQLRRAPDRRRRAAGDGEDARWPHAPSLEQPLLEPPLPPTKERT